MEKVSSLEVKAPSMQEKTKFSTNLFSIASDELGKVVTILDEKCEICIDKTDPDEIEINIDAIDPKVFREVETFVKQCISSKTNKRKRDD